VLIVTLFPSISRAQSSILVFGDSLSAGYGIPRESSWPILLQAELQHTQPHYKIINASISGETTSGGLKRLPATLNEHHPSIVIIELGANDGLRGAKINLIEMNLTQMIEKSKAAGAKVLLLGMQIPPNYGIQYAQNFKAIYPKLAKRHRLTLVPYMLEGVEPDQFQADNLHPVAEVQPKILETILQKLKLML